VEARIEEDILEQPVIAPRTRPTSARCRSRGRQTMLAAIDDQTDYDRGAMRRASRREFSIPGFRLTLLPVNIS